MKEKAQRNAERMHYAMKPTKLDKTTDDNGQVGMLIDGPL